MTILDSYGNYETTVTEKKWWLRQRLSEIPGYGILEPGQVLSTGDNSVELFDTEEDLKARCIELGYPIIEKDNIEMEE